MKVKLLIDGDILVYRCGFACQKSNKPIEPLAHALHLVKKAIADMKLKFNTFNYKVYLTSDDRSNFRFKRATILPYKGNRDVRTNPNASGKPRYYDQIRDYILTQYNSVLIKDIEADDALGIAQCSLFANREWEPIICSIDKDLDMIPGRHYNFVKDEEYFVKDPGELELSEDKKKIRGGGLLWFYAQMLLGDKSDNIPKLKGHGPVKVYSILHECITEEEMWEEVYKAYEMAFEDKTKEELLDYIYEVADLLWIWRTEKDCKSNMLRGLL